MADGLLKQTTSIACVACSVAWSSTAKDTEKSDCILCNAMACSLSVVVMGVCGAAHRSESAAHFL